MKRIASLTTFVLLFISTAIVTAQIPGETDPGNVRGDEGTQYLWSNPSVYIPLLIVVAIVVGGLIYRKKNASKP